jgi:hypothetical protein
MRPLFAVETTRFPQLPPNLVPHEIVLLDLYLRMVAGAKRTRSLDALCFRMQTSSRRYFPQTRSPGQTGIAWQRIGGAGRLDPTFGNSPRTGKADSSPPGRCANASRSVRRFLGAYQQSDQARWIPPGGAPKLQHLASGLDPSFRCLIVCHPSRRQCGGRVRADIRDRDADPLPSGKSKVTLTMDPRVKPEDDKKAWSPAPSTVGRLINCHPQAWPTAGRLSD